MRVAYFTGHEADRDGRRATDEEAREYYVNLLLELGQTLRAIGYEERIQALEAGTESPRLMAVELLRYAVAGDRAAVAHLDSEMRSNVFGGGGDAAAYVKNDLRYEVLGMRPPVPVPPGWEGPRPDEEIRTPADFITWADRQLEVLHLFFGRLDERSTGADARNTYRLLTHLAIPHDYPFPHGGMTNGEEEAHFWNLHNVCLSAVAPTQNHQALARSTETGEQPLHTPVPATQPTGAGGAEGRALPATIEPDGPFGADGFRFAGVEVRFGRAVLQQRLVLALWDAEKQQVAPPRQVEAVMDDVYGAEHRTEDSTFRKLCSETRTRLATAGCSLTIKTPTPGVLQPGAEVVMRRNWRVHHQNADSGSSATLPVVRRCEFFAR